MRIKSRPAALAALGALSVRIATFCGMPQRCEDIDDKSAPQVKCQA